MSTLFDDGSRGANISADKLYRYGLWRRWSDGPVLGWVMLNPSTGDATLDDQTLRRCMHFAKREGYAGIAVRNLFAYRTAYPTELADAEKAGVDIVGPDNDDWLDDLLEDRFAVSRIVAAWGLSGPRSTGDRIAWLHGRCRAQRRELYRLRWPPDRPTAGPAAPHPARAGNEWPIDPYPTEDP